MDGFLTENLVFLPDEELVKAINTGNDSALQVLVERYLPFMRTKAAEFAGDYGIDIEDLVQEALIALYSSVKIYNPALSTFNTFASVCIKRNLISVCRTQLRKKQIPKEKLVYNDTESEIITDKSPEALLIEKEESHILIDKIKSILSDFEYKVLLAYIAYGSYDVIADNLDISVKSVNNSMCRIRNKIRKIC